MELVIQEFVPGHVEELVPDNAEDYVVLDNGEETVGPNQVQYGNNPSQKTLNMVIMALFDLQFICNIILSTYLGPYELIRGIHTKRFNRITNLLVPMLSSITSGGIIALMWQWFLSCKPTTAIGSYFLSLNGLPVRVLSEILLHFSSRGTRRASAVVGIIGQFQLFYAPNVAPNVEYVQRLIYISVAVAIPTKNCILTVAMLLTVVYSSLLVTSIFGAIATRNRVFLFL